MSDTAESLWPVPHFEGRLAPLGRRELEKHIQQLEEQAREAGFNQGLEAGMTAAKKEVAASCESANRLVDELKNYLKILDDQLVGEILNLAKDIAAKVISAEITQNPDLILNGISEAISAVDPSVSELTIRLHPSDHDFIKNQDGIRLTSESLRIESDQTLSRGDCILSNSVTTAESLINEKICQVISNLKA